MNKFTRLVCACVLLGLPLAGACDQVATAKVQVEKLPAVTPSLPAVPTLPPPPFPTQYGDQSYSVYGVRRALRKTIDTDINLTGYIVSVFVPEECPKGTKCPMPPAPHIWVADTKGEADKGKMLIVAGYAENQTAIDDAVKDAAKAAKRGKPPATPPEDTGILPIPTDFFVGAKVKLKGRFSYISGSGFQSSEGVLTYAGHETIEAAPEIAAK